MSNEYSSIVKTLLGLPIFHSEWVLYLLLGLSLLSIAVMIERWIFYRRRRIDIDAVGLALAEALDDGDFERPRRSPSTTFSRRAWC